MREQIQQLIAEGRTEEALDLLEKSNSDAVLLKARYNNGKKQYNMGLIDYGEWNRVQNGVNYAALEMSGQSRTVITPPTVTTPAPAPAPAPPVQARPADQAPTSVFISYNHEDMFAMRTVKDFLEEKGVQVHVDIFRMQAGEKIQDFIDQALRDHSTVVTLISKDSLTSGWVSIELSSVLLLSRLGSRWIPASLDKSFLDNKFLRDTEKKFDRRIEKAKAEMLRALNSNADSRPLQDELSRLQDMKANFGKLIQALRQMNVVDISGQMFDVGMPRIANTVQAT